jgi:hypothetical protein
MDPIIIELPKEVFERKYRMKEKKKFLGYEYECDSCDAHGYLRNQFQMMCPRCGAPFVFASLAERVACYEPAEVITRNYNQPQFIKDTTVTRNTMGDEVIVEDEIQNAFKDLFEREQHLVQDLVTDMEDYDAI